MYVVIVYDIAVERIDRVRKFLKQYLMWRQNSVFEGEITKAEFERIKSELKDMIVKEEDNIIFYIVRDEKYLKREEMGTSKVETSNII